MELAEQPKNLKQWAFAYSWLLIPLFAALIIRTVYYSFQIPDFWGDSYHNWYISWSILEHDWVYSDYKGRELVWLPFYRYLVAGLMYVFEGDGLQLGHIFNIITGSVSCGIVAWFVKEFRDTKTALLAGLLLAVLPWHIAYSTMNLPNILGGMLILVLILQAFKGRYLVTMLLTVICVLTRYELTYMLMFFGVITILRKEWKTAGSLLAGGVMGIGIWSVWSYMNTGDFLFWLSEKSAGLSWDAFFQQRDQGAGRTWYFPLLAILQAFPLVLLMVVPGNIKKKGAGWKVWLPLLLAAGHWAFMLISQFQYYSSADPRYLIISLPLACAGIMLLWNEQVFWKRSVNKILVTVIAVVFVGQVISFRFISYTWNKYIGAGEYIEEANLEGNMWIDKPAVIYYSGMDPAYAYSSEQIAPAARVNEASLAHTLDSLQIEYVVAIKGSYSKTLWIWPEMKQSQSFTWNEYRFSQVYRFSPYANTEQTWFGNIRQRVEANSGETSIWKVQKSEFEL